MPKRVKYSLEIEVKSSPAILYSHITSPSGLAEWFCDDVNLQGGVYIFKWDGVETQAEVVKTVPNKHVRFRWIDGPDDEFFEMEVMVDDLTSDVALMITDFADEDDVTGSKQLWESQVQQLKMAIGS